MKTSPVILLLGAILLIPLAGIAQQPPPPNDQREGEENESLEAKRDFLSKKIEEYATKKVFTEGVVTQLEKALDEATKKMNDLKAAGPLSEENTEALREEFRKVRNKVREQLNDPVTQRKRNFCENLEEGQKDGSLSEQEVKSLQRDYDRICEKEERYRADGTLTSSERQSLENDLRSLNKKKRKESRDGDHRRD
jgi:chromosome segregation ATPase